MIYRGRHDEGVVGGRFQVPRFQTKVRNVKVLGWNVIVDVTVEHKNLHKGLFIEHVIRKGGGGYFQSNHYITHPCRGAKNNLTDGI